MLSKFSVKKPLTILVSVVAILVLGVISFTRMTTDLLPSMDLPYVAVITSCPGSGPEKVETSVTKPLEQVLSTAGGVENITSVSSENSSMVLIQVSMRKSYCAGGWQTTIAVKLMRKISCFI